MSSIGPQLPPHLSKRKRSPQDESPDSPLTKSSKPNNENEIALDGEGSDSDDAYGPTAPNPATAGPRRPLIGPALPPTASSSNTTEIAPDFDSGDDTGPAQPAPKSTAPQPAPKPKRIMGPAAPPADLTERPITAPDSDSDANSGSDSEDDYGPALPSAAQNNPKTTSPQDRSHQIPEKPPAPKRDDWMLAPPPPTGYQERDPTKIKARKFASGTSATSRPKGGGGISSIWTETPEEKAKRLADAVLGRGAAGGTADEQAAAVAAARKGPSGAAGGTADSKEQQDRIRAFTEQTRGKSLYEQHQAAKKAGGGGTSTSRSKNAVGADGGDQVGEEEGDDDPSKRAFDREKDMGLGMKITASQRKELLNRASDFGGRFQKGNYL